METALFLFILGLLLYVMEWTGIYYTTMVFTFSLLPYSLQSEKALLFLSIIILLLAQSLQLTFNAFEGWGGPTPFINYVDF